MKGKIIVIEGTDCSGKETQSKLLIDKLNKEGLETKYVGFPYYDSPTGMIVGLPYLGKPFLASKLVLSNFNKVYKDVMCEGYDIDKDMLRAVLNSLTKNISHGWFKEGAPNVDAKVCSLYYAADRAYNKDLILEEVDKGHNVILDRYVYSNMAHQGGKIADEIERKAMYEWLYKLEFDLLDLPTTDIRLFLHMPTDYTALLKAGRTEALDEHEKNVKHLNDAERAYLEVADLYDFTTINCIEEKLDKVCMENVKKPEEIGEEVYNVVKKELINH